MAKGELRTAKIEDAELLAPLLCPEDLVELDALGFKPVDAIKSSIEASRKALSIFIDGEIAAVLGVAPRVWGGQFWLLTGLAVRRAPIAFLKQGKLAFEMLSAGEALMANVVDARHEQALRLAERFGFFIADAQPHGRNGEPFRPIIWPWEAAHVHRT